MGFTLTASGGDGVPTGERGTWTRQTAVQMENASKKQTRCNCSRQVGGCEKNMQLTNCETILLQSRQANALQVFHSLRRYGRTRKARRGIINRREKERTDVNSVRSSLSLPKTRYKSAAEHENARIYMLRRPRRRRREARGGGDRTRYH